MSGWSVIFASQRGKVMGAWNASLARSIGRYAARSFVASLPFFLQHGSPVRRPKKLPVYLKSPHARIPTRAYPDDAGLDIYVSEDVEILPGEIAVIPSGISVEIPRGTFGYVTGRNSWAGKGLLVFPSVIHSGYRGLIEVTAINLGRQVLYVERGNKVAQLIVMPYIELDPEDRTGVTFENKKYRPRRGTKGAGSTGM